MADSSSTSLAVPIQTTSWGSPVEDNQNSESAGPDGPLLLQDTHLIDKLAHFDRERIPERVVHAKGTKKGRCLCVCVYVCMCCLMFL